MADNSNGVDTTDLVNMTEAARLLGMSSAGVSMSLKRGKFPAPVKRGGAGRNGQVWFRKSDVLNYEPPGRGRSVSNSAVQAVISAFAGTHNLASAARDAGVTQKTAKKILKRHGRLGRAMCACPRCPSNRA